MNTLSSHGIKSFWLTVNRECQLRCEWCYASDLSFKKEDDMDKQLAYRIIDLCADLKIQRCTLLGGEPSIYPALFEILERLRDRKITTGLVSNGVRFSDFSFTQHLKPFLEGVTVALKAGNERDFAMVTNSKSFHDIAQGVQNLKEVGIPFNISILMNTSLMEKVEEMICFADSLGVESVQLDICNPTITSSAVVGRLSPEPYMVAKKLLDIDKQVGNLNCRVNYAVRTPFCTLPRSFINRTRSENRLVSGCQLNRHDGLIFDQSGKILPCNLLSECVLGEIGIDFDDPISFKNFWSGPKVREFFDATKRVPSKECNSCSDYSECCGGCPVRWLYFDPSHYIKKRR